MIHDTPAIFTKKMSKSFKDKSLKNWSTFLCDAAIGTFESHNPQKEYEPSKQKHLAEKFLMFSRERTPPPPSFVATIAQKHTAVTPNSTAPI